MTHDKYWLSHGSHSSPAEGRCAMEWVAYVAGEPHSDQPVCVSPVLRTFGIYFNDALDDENRQRLRPYLARCIGTADDGLDEQRAWMCTDWLVRTFAPTWLDLAGLHSHASNLRSLGEVLSAATASEAQPRLDAAWAAAGDAAWAAARDAAGAAAWAAAGAAARDAAGAAARAAAWDAAGDAAGDAAWAAAWAAAGAAAWDAAGAAARAAAGDAAGDALKPTVKTLQDSAFDLFDRMLPTEPLELPAPVQERAKEVIEA